MKYLQHIKHYFYSEEKRFSNSQIIEDFGGFPPFPLNCKNLGIEFSIVKTRGIGGLYANLLLFKRLSQVREISEINESFHCIWKEISDIKSQFKILSDTIKTKGQRFFFVVVLVPLICLVALIVFPVRVFNIACLLINSYRKIPKGLGYFTPYFIDERRIVINVGTIKNINDTESIISHEHIHLLQHKNKNFKIDKKNARCNDILLTGEGKNDSYLLYLLDRNEVEARLHEIVISYYRIKNTLPLTMEGFVEILAGSNNFGSLVIKTMDFHDVAIEQGIAKYHERNTNIAKDVHKILMAIKDIDLRRRFITEVLAVMYGNLIKYYGDDESSLNFLSKIDRPNLCDMLYAQ